MVQQGQPADRETQSHEVNPVLSSARLLFLLSASKLMPVLRLFSEMRGSVFVSCRTLLQ